MRKSFKLWLVSLLAFVTGVGAGCNFLQNPFAPAESSETESSANSSASSEESLEAESSLESLEGSWGDGIGRIVGEFGIF